jgi:hypothetical protein
MQPVPVIRLEVERMRQTMVAHLSNAALQLDEDIQCAVEAYCQPDHLSKIIHDETERTLNAVIAEEVQKFFRYGEGRKAVAESVKKRLLEATTYTPLDDVE